MVIPCLHRLRPILMVAHLLVARSREKDSRSLCSTVDRASPTTWSCSAARLMVGTRSATSSGASLLQLPTRADAVAARLSGPEASDADATESLALRWPGYFPDPSAAPPLPSDFRVSLVCNGETVGSLFEALDGTFAQSLRRLELPAVFVLGADSPLLPGNGQQTAALMPDAEVDVIARAGHLPWVEEPGCVAEALSRLKKKVREG